MLDATLLQVTMLAPTPLSFELPQSFSFFVRDFQPVNQGMIAFQDGLFFPFSFQKFDWPQTRDSCMEKRDVLRIPVRIRD